MMRNKIIILKLLLVSIIVLHGCFDSGDSNIVVVYDQKNLNIGKQPGTFSFVFKVNFSDNVKIDFPVDVQIRQETIYGNVLYSKRLEKIGETSLAVDLSPGNYIITSSPVEDIHRKEFWDGIGPEFEIDKSGLLKYSPVDINYKRRIKVNTPQGNLNIPGKKTSLQLEWVPVKDAKSYGITWEIESSETGEVIRTFKIRSIKETKFEFNFDIDLDLMKENKYQIYWMLHAYNNSGIPIGFASNQFRVILNEK